MKTLKTILVPVAALLAFFFMSQAQQVSAPSASATAAPSGAAGGSLAGTYPNPTIATLGQALLFTDNSFDIGAVAATRPRTGYFGTSVIAPTGTFATAMNTALIQSATNCADSAGAAACGAAPAGAFVIDAGATATVVSTTAVTANSEIFVQFDSSLSTRLSVTCNTGIATAAIGSVTARTAGASFTYTITGTLAVNPGCFTFLVVN